MSLLMFQVWPRGSSSFAQRELSLVANLNWRRAGIERAYEAMLLGRRGNLICASPLFGLPSQRGTLQRVSGTNLPSNLDHSRALSLLEKDASGCTARWLVSWPETTSGEAAKVLRRLNTNGLVLSSRLPVFTDRQCDVDVLKTHFDEKSHDQKGYSEGSACGCHVGYHIGRA